MMRTVSNHLYFGRRLEACFERMKQLPLTVVTAPVGSGKTTAVREYLRRTGVSYCLLRGESARELLMTQLEQQLRMSIFSYGELEPAQVASLFLDKVTVSLTLVVEDYHSVTSWGDCFFQALAAGAIQNQCPLTLILVGRERVPWAAEWILSGCCCAVSLSELSLAEDELGAFFLRQGISLEDGEAIRLFEWTAGWMPALCACIDQHRRDGVLQLPGDFLLWMTQAVWEQMEPAERQVLLRLSPFERFTMGQAGDFVQFFLSELDLSSVLAALPHHCLFLSSEQGQELYRPHPVFWRCVRGQFDCLPREERQRILSRAGRELLSRQEWSEGTLLLCEAEDWDGLSRLLESRGVSRLPASVLERLLMVLDRCPSMTLSPGGAWMLALLRQVWTDMPCPLPLTAQKGGIAGLRLFLQQVAAERPELLPQVVQLLLCWGAPVFLLHFSSSEETLADELELLQQLSDEPLFDRLLDALVCEMKAEYALLQGDLAQAQLYARSVLMIAPRLSQWGGYLSAVLLLCLIADLQGEATEGWLEQAMDRLEQHRVAALLPIAQLGQVYLQRHHQQLPIGEEALFLPSHRLFFALVNLLRLSEENWQAALAYGECLLSSSNSLVFRIICCVICGAVASRMKDTARMWRYLRRGLALAEAEAFWLPFTVKDLVPLLPQLEDKAVEDVLQLAGQLRDAGQEPVTALTQRERQMALLAARGFSNREISERLFLSENTVKSRMKVIFDKLDIHSRRELRRIFGLES